MLGSDTCELPHTTSYVYNQSYKFVLHDTKNYFPPEPKKLAQHHNCMVLQVHSSMYNQNLFSARTKNWHNSTSGKKVPPAHAKRGQVPPAHAKRVCLSVCDSVRKGQERDVE